MSLWRAIVCVIFPPLGVYDRGCGNILLVGILTLIGWIPGVIAAMVVCNISTPNGPRECCNQKDWRKGE
jgi:uncharacterized membrane protein YqaE (UPF0057 family)